MGTPSFRSELRRGLNAYNLAVGAAAAAAVGMAAGLLIAADILPPFVDGGPLLHGSALAAVAFAAITFVHAGAHATVGLLLGRGVSASLAARHDLAVRRLRLVERPGMSHYDPEGLAARALAASRAALAERAR